MRHNMLVFFQQTIKDRIEAGVVEYIHLQPTNPYNIEDACSFLEQLRAYQLSDILGKYKLF